MMGSVVFVGEYLLVQVFVVKDFDGIMFDEVLCNIGYKGECQLGDMVVDSYVELYIEQGLIFDKEQIDIGVVIGVQGILWQEFILRGVLNYVGIILMFMRCDVGLVVVKIVVFVCELVLSFGGD